jgi:hypothetical protein
MKRLAILMSFAGLVSLPSGAQSEEKASPLTTALSTTTIGGYVSSSVWRVRPAPGDPVSGYRQTPSGWRAHICRWSHHINVANRTGFRDRGVYGRCRHGIIYLPTRRVPGRPLPPLPPTPIPRPPPGTNPVPPPIMRLLPPVPGQAILLEANRMPRSETRPPLPPPLPPTALVTSAPPIGVAQPTSVIRETLGEGRYLEYERSTNVFSRTTNRRFLRQ